MQNAPSRRQWIHANKVVGIGWVDRQSIAHVQGTKLNHLDSMGYRASRHAVSGAGDVKHVQVISRDDPVQVNVDEVLTRRGAPMPDHERLYVRGGGGGGVV